MQGVTRRLRSAPLGIAIAAIAILGWNQFWFLTDDAFINFRYCSNIVEGRGPVWNPPPFLPVEGYTSPSWVLLLAAIWAAVGVDPPTAANTVSLGCSLATLWVCWVLCRRQTGAPVLSVLAVAAIATQPTFLTWSSSGFETALYNLCVIAWICCATREPVSPARWSLALSGSACAAALTRPDAFLLVAGTAVILAHRVATRRSAITPLLAALPPVALVAGHLLWRRWFYGYWLPNTYHAKVVEPWPDSGWRYFAVFAVEHGLWLWIVPVAIALTRSGALRALPSTRFGTLVAVGVSAAAIGYYTLVIGGDHFEFRVFSVYVPLLFVTYRWACATLFRSTALAAAAMLLLIVASHTLGWVQHLAAERTARPRASVHEVTAATPAWLRHVLERPVPDAALIRVANVWLPVPSWCIDAYDAWNGWLHIHLVGLRRHVHVAALRDFVELAPTREVGQTIGWHDRPIAQLSTVGYAGWVLPDVAIIDVLGLNDRVIAHYDAPRVPYTGLSLAEWFARLDTDGNGAIGHAELKGLGPGLALADANHDDQLAWDEWHAGGRAFGGRRMAHDRMPPPGYVEAFEPNVTVASGKAHVHPRPSPLTDDEIRAADAGASR